MILVIFFSDFLWEGGGTLPQIAIDLFRTYEKLLSKGEPYKLSG